MCLSLSHKHISVVQVVLWDLHGVQTAWKVRLTNASMGFRFVNTEEKNLMWGKEKTWHLGVKKQNFSLLHIGLKRDWILSKEISVFRKQSTLELRAKLVCTSSNTVIVCAEPHILSGHWCNALSKSRSLEHCGSLHFLQNTHHSRFTTYSQSWYLVAYPNQTWGDQNLYKPSLKH